MKKQLSLETIEKWLRDADCDVRQAAMTACQGREVPLEFIEKGLRDADWRVRQAAMTACQGKDAISRTFEPPKEVYKKCFGGVIVCAHIPADAHIRGAEGRKCRASKAEIKRVIGNVCGEPVGISKHDMKTLYYEGDIVDIPDFDLSLEECSTGFHFFCSRIEAENY